MRPTKTSEFDDLIRECGADLPQSDEHHLVDLMHDLDGSDTLTPSE